MGSKFGPSALAFAPSVLWSLGPGLGEAPGAPSDWREAPRDEALEPGDLGAGTDDLDAGRWYAPRRARRVPISFSAVVLLLTLTVGMGMSAGLLAGPSAWDPFAHPSSVAGHNGTGSPHGIGSNGTGGAPPGNITIPTNPNGTSNSTGRSGGNSTGSHPGGNGSTSGGNSTGNRTGSTGNTSGKSGNSTGNKTGGTNGTNPNGSNGTKPPTSKPKTPTQPTVIYRNQLPWLPTDSRFLLVVGAALGLGGLAVAVIIESLRPPPDRSNPWGGAVGAVRRPSRRSPLFDPKRSLDSAVRSLRAELVRYHRAGGAAVDTEVRERIVQLYGALLQAVGPGLGSVEQRTPREVEWMSVRYLGVGPATAHLLTEMFEEARYSSHRLRPDVVERAEQALAALVEDLDRRRWEL